MSKPFLYLGLLASLVASVYLSRLKQANSFISKASDSEYKYYCRPTDSINIDFIDPLPPPKKADDLPVQNVTIRHGQKINVVIGISGLDASQTNTRPHFVAYKRLKSGASFQYEKIGMLNEKLQASPWPGVFSVSLTYDQIAAYLKNDSRDEARDYLQLNGQLDDPYAEPMLRAGTTACVARITLADRVPYVAASPNSPERIYPISPSPITTNTSPTPSPTIKPQSDPNIIDTSNYWPKRGKSYLYKGYNYGSYSGGRQNPITGRMQLDILPASLCGIQGDNYRFTKSNPFMYWTPCISGSCDKTSPNSEMVFAYENYKTLQSQNTLISTMTLPFDTVVQPMEGIKGEKTGKPFLKDDATTLSNLTYAAFTRAQYANMEKNYPIVLKQPENYRHITQQPYDTIFTYDPTGQTKVGYPFLPRFFDSNNPLSADLGAENMIFMRTTSRMGMCDIKANLESLIPRNANPVPIPTRTDRPGIHLFNTQYVNYSFFAKKKVELRNPNGEMFYSGYPLIVSMHEMYKDQGCTLSTFTQGKCSHVLREDWYLAPNIGLVRLEQKYINIYFSKPNQIPCNADKDCYSREEMEDPDYVMELMTFDDTPNPANDPTYDVPYNIFDASSQSAASPATPSQTPSTQTQNKKTTLHHQFYMQADPAYGPSFPFVKTVVGILNQSDYYCVKLPSKQACVAAIEDQCGIPGDGRPRNYFTNTQRPNFCNNDNDRANTMQDRCGKLFNEPVFITVEQEKKTLPQNRTGAKFYDYKCQWSKSQGSNGRAYDIFDVSITIPTSDIGIWQEEYSYAWGNTTIPIAFTIPVVSGPIKFTPENVSGYPRTAVPNTDSDVQPGDDKIEIKVVTIDP